MNILEYYQKQDIQKEILFSAKQREVAIKFQEKFGKRPDLLQFENDIKEAVDKGATSFHISEEHWDNPLLLKKGMQQSRLNELRIGFDLVIDIDFEIWECTKLISQEIVKALRTHGINTISAKFSGNKGFHIGMPFEIFPKEFRGNPTKNLFPEGTRNILKYLIKYIDNDFMLSKKIIENKEFQSHPEKNKFLTKVCTRCQKKKKKSIISQFICTHCGKIIEDDSSIKYKQCPNCQKLTKRIKQEEKCSCGNDQYETKINLQVDTQLITNRHLFRSPYSLNEKKGLVSIPIDPDKILQFEKDQAKPENVQISRFRFLDGHNVKQPEAIHLLDEAFNLAEKIEIKRYKRSKIISNIKHPINKDLFPPCISIALDKGLEDGKKRFLFVLQNFLSNLGYSNKDIKNLVLNWNKKNQKRLAEQYIQSQLNWHKRSTQKILPPNCPEFSNTSYYQDIGICHPDNFCKTIKNPAQYVLKKYRMEKEVKSKSKSKKR